MARPNGKEGETRALVALLLDRFPTMTQKQIADKLGITPATVYHHVSNIEDCPEHSVAMSLLRKTLPDASLIVALENKRILDKVLAGEGLTADEIKVVQGALKGGRVYQEKQQTEPSDVPTQIDVVIRSIMSMSPEDQHKLLAQYNVRQIDRAPADPQADRPAADPNAGGAVDNISGQAGTDAPQEVKHDEPSG